MSNRIQKGFSVSLESRHGKDAPETGSLPSQSSIDPDSDLSDADSDMEEVKDRLADVEQKVGILNVRISREMGHGRKKNLIVFQIAGQQNESPKKPEILKGYMAKFIDDNIIREKGWALPKIKNCFRMNSAEDAGPIVIRFDAIENAHFVLANCKHLASYNANRKNAGGRPMSVRRHMDPKTNQESQYLGQIARKLKGMDLFKDKPVHVLDQVDPVLVVDDKKFKMHQIPGEYLKLVGPYKGF